MAAEETMSQTHGEPPTTQEVEKPADETKTDGNPVVVVKHPLQSRWHLWYYKPDKSRGWEDNLLGVTHFDTVEDFWALYNHIELASNLTVGSDYCIFKFGIKPMWEDVRNKRGGRWLFTFNKKDAPSRQIDETWLEVLLCLIGEAFGEESDGVCGAVINVRAKMDKIAIWTSDAKNEGATKKIGRILKQRISYQKTATFEAHEDTQSKTGSSARHLFQV